MPTKVQCPNPECGLSASVPEERLGHAARCKRCGTRFTLSPSRDGSPAPGTPGAAAVLPGVVGRYQIRAKLGSGAFGTVYRAYDPQLEREVALKLLHPEALGSRNAVERFQREARTAARMHHPHIVPVYDAGQLAEQSFIASAFIPGCTLASAIPEEGMDQSRAARLMLQLVEALAYAHKQGVLHRDVKPVNIMLDKQDTLYLMDFGLAGWTQQASSRLTRVGAVLGTPSYMAPEQARGDLQQVGPSADLYSAGVVLYEMLTGQVPFEGALEAVIYNAIHTPPPPPSQHRPDLDPNLEALCLKAIAKKPEERFADAQEMAEALQGWLQGQKPPAQRPGNPASPRSPAPPTLGSGHLTESLPGAGRETIVLAGREWQARWGHLCPPNPPPGGVGGAQVPPGPAEPGGCNRPFQKWRPWLLPAGVVAALVIGLAILFVAIRSKSAVGDPKEPVDSPEWASLHTPAEALELLKSSNNPARSRALAYLSNTEPAGAEQAEIAQHLTSMVGKGGVAGVEEALIKWATSEQVPALRLIIESTPVGVGNDRRQAAIRMLGQLQDKRGLDIIVDRLGDPLDRNAAQTALELFGDKAKEKLIHNAFHKNGETRDAVQKTLQKYKTPPEEFIPQALKDIGSPDNAVQRAALDFLSKTPPVAEQQADVARALENLLADQQARGAALKALQTWATTDSVPALLGLWDKPGAPRSELREIFANLKDKRGAVVVAQQLKDAGERDKAMAALKKMGPDVARQVLAGYQNDPEDGVSDLVRHQLQSWEWPQPEVLAADEGVATVVLGQIKTYVWDQNFEKVLVLHHGSGQTEMRQLKGKLRGRAAPFIPGSNQPPSMQPGPQPGPFGRGAIGLTWPDGKEHPASWVELKDLDRPEEKGTYVKLATAIHPLRMALITASFPYKAQLNEFKNKLSLPDYQSVLKESSRQLDDKRQPLPAFRFLGARLQRRAVDALGKPLPASTPDGWETIDLEKDYKHYLFLNGIQTQPDDPHLDAISLDGLVMPRLLPARETRPESPMYPPLERRLQNIQKTLAELASARTNPAQLGLPRQFARDPLDIFKKGDAADAPDNPGGNKQVPVPGLPAVAPKQVQDVKPPTHCLVRLIDVTIKPGTIYEYRLRVRMANPNYRRGDKSNPQNAQGEELASDKWYVIPETVMVPPEVSYYAVDQQELEGANNYKGLNAGPVIVKGDQVAFQIQRWVENAPDRTPVGEWAVAERIFVNRGEYIGRTVSVEVPIWRSKADSFVIPQQGRKSPGISINFADPPNEAILVDFEDPNRAYKRGAAYVNEHTTTEVVILSSDGKLLVHDSKSDQKNAQRIERLNEWRDRVKEAKQGGTRGKGPDFGR